MNQTVDVKFVAHNGGVRGTHPSFRKIAFVAHKYRGIMPQVGEQWSCQVWEAKPGQSKGVLVLLPEQKIGAPQSNIAPRASFAVQLKQVAERIYVEVIRSNYAGTTYTGRDLYSVDNIAGIDPTWPLETRQKIEAEFKRQPQKKFQVKVFEDKGGVSAKVLRWSVIGNISFGNSETTVVENAQIDASWPEWVKRRLEAAFLGAEFRRIQEARKQARTVPAGEQVAQPVVLKPQQLDAQQRALITKLVDPQPILKVEELTVRHLKIAVVDLPGDPEQLKAVLLDGQLIGLGNTSTFGLGNTAPSVIEVRTLKLSNGEEVEIASHSLDVLFYRSESYTTRRTKLCSALVNLNTKGRASISWNEAIKLQAGDAFTQEYRFQWVEDWLTNGVVWFPRERPFGSDWRYYPVPSIPAECWDMFLTGLEGKLLDSLIPFHRQVTTKPKTHREPMSPQQREIAAIINGQMFQGSEEGCEHVGVGRNMVFTKTRPGRSTIYIVDNPGIGALFLFTDRDEAMRLASGRVLRSEVTTHIAKIIHIEGWQAKLNEALDTLD